jgi:predicted DNA-binding ribbon-helix-helix protein
MLSPSLVILIPQSREKNLRSSLRVNCAKHLCSSSADAKRKKTAEILRPPKSRAGSG